MSSRAVTRAKIKVYERCEAKIEAQATFADAAAAADVDDDNDDAFNRVLHLTNRRFVGAVMIF